LSGRGKYVSIFFSICFDLIAIFCAVFLFAFQKEINSQILLLSFIFSAIISIFAMLLLRKVNIDVFIDVIKYFSVFLFLIIGVLADNYANFFDIARGSDMYLKISLPAIFPFISLIIFTVIEFKESNTKE
jgi:hypothetical protein